MCCFETFPLKDVLQISTDEDGHGNITQDGHGNIIQDGNNYGNITDRDGQTFQIRKQLKI